jgi:hypothetical protein
MGLDQYAYVAAKAEAYDEYWEDENYEKAEDDPTKLSKPIELAYWRKHPNLQGWMERLWLEKNPDADQETDYVFNGVELELTWDDLDRLEADVKAGNLPKTRGFFFGDDSDDHYKQDDLEFIKKAKAEVFLGLKVFYNSSW